MGRQIEELEPRTREMCQRLLVKAHEAGMSLVLVQTHRSYEEQEGLYAKGRSRPGPVVTNARAGHSWHNFRRAFDVAFMKGSQLSWDGPWDVLGKMGEEIGLEWGGRWENFPDRPHFQFTGGETLARMRAMSLVRTADLATTRHTISEEEHA